METRVKSLEAQVKSLECMVIALITVLDAIHEDDNPSDGVVWILEREAESLRSSRKGLRAFYLDGLTSNLKDYLAAVR